ncbi:disease resistance protein RUN1-like [Eucalyptus grandis]|uniref:disease resistance protein RUN1-like n=1 Tax=Eucalyptus grandis TaxID=71139 RepID=UPI00192EAC86|nr:disease resistance protein RUN1-like [Eucalyptus grandis]
MSVLEVAFEKGIADPPEGSVVDSCLSKSRIPDQVEIVKSIVENVLEKLEIKQKEVHRHLVRLDDQVEQLTWLSAMDQRDVRLIANCGMGEIGKITMAKVIFNQLSSHFGRCCSFLEDVRVGSSTEEGKVRLQKKLLYDIVGSRLAEQVKDSEQGKKRIREVLHIKEVLLVLDDVAKEQHIEHLIGNYSLCSGSRIIITTIDKTIPLDEGFNGKIRQYEMLDMDARHALQLFCRHAFGTNSPSNDYCWLSNDIVSSVGGLHLAIEVIGSSLKRKNKAVWKEMLDNSKNVPEEEILNKLKISYDGLDNN